MPRRQLPIGRWCGLGWLASMAFITLGLLLGGARQNAVLAYVEAYGETWQLRMTDVDRLLDQGLALYVDCDLSWQPDGWTVFFTSTRPGQPHQIVQLAPFTHREQSRLSAESHIEAPAISPDGSLLAFAANADVANDVMLLDRATGEQRVVAQLPIWISTQRWLPDGQGVVVHGIEANRYERTYMVDVATGEATRFDDPDAVNWSPDRERRAYVQLGAEDGLYVANVTGGDAQRVSDALDRLPVWSPDGRSLVFVGGTEAEQRLALLDVPSGEVRWLTPPMFRDVSLMVWSPDGTQIAFGARDQDVEPRHRAIAPYHIYTVSASGGDVRMVRHGFGEYINNFSRYCAFAWRP
ncbi:MAG: PD40 domain-containing protein [Anaerolineae bacterium]|nr:PD40 domain-containing protein [Anaerolineae bacterium]